MSGDHLPAATDHRLPWGLPVEQWRLATAAIAFGVAFLAALLLTWGDSHPLFGTSSVGEYASLVGAAVAAATFTVWFLWVLRGPAHRWRRRIRIVFRIIDFIGLALTHAAVAMLGLSGLFWIFSEAFVDLRLDGLATSTITATGAAVVAYLAVGSAVAMSTRQLAQLLAVFVAVGALSSMLSASDPLWWQSHFSSLGAATDLSGLAFNFTLFLGGLVITTLAGFLTHDLMNWARLAGVDPRRVFALRIMIVLMGLLLAALAFLPVDRFFVTHNVVAYTMVAVFLAMATGVPLLFPTLSRPFSVLCVVTLSVLVAGLVAYLGVGYLNLTAFELLMVAGIFSWMILFISTVDSAAQHLAASPRSAATQLTPGAPHHIRIWQRSDEDLRHDGLEDELEPVSAPAGSGEQASVRGQDGEQPGVRGDGAPAPGSARQG